MYRKDRQKEHYTEKARYQGYVARSVYKLKELDEKHHLFKKGDAVLDIGAAPGSWLQYVADKVGPKGRVVGIDIQPIAEEVQKLPNVTFLQKDIQELSAHDIASLGEFDLVISDAAPKTTGIVSLDAGKSVELAERAWRIAQHVLKKGGTFVCKVFAGEGSDVFLKNVRERSASVKRARPRAVTKNSKEFYIVAKKYDGKNE